MEVETLTEHLDFLAMKVETISIALQSCSIALKEVNKLEVAIKAEEPLMLPAPEKRKPVNLRCPVCNKFLRKGETVHEKCKQ